MGAKKYIIISRNHLQLLNVKWFHIWLQNLSVVMNYWYFDTASLVPMVPMVYFVLIRFRYSVPTKKMLLRKPHQHHSNQRSRLAPCSRPRTYHIKSEYCLYLPNIAPTLDRNNTPFINASCQIRKCRLTLASCLNTSFNVSKNVWTNRWQDPFC